MKFNFGLFRLENLINELKIIISRFPLLIFYVIIIASLFFINLHFDLELKFENITFKLILTMIVAFFLSLGVYLFFESNKEKSSTLLDKIFKKGSKIKSSTTNIYFQILVLIFGILFYNSFTKDIDSVDNAIFFILTQVGVISLLFFSPYIKKLTLPKIQNIYYSYFYKTSVVFLMSFILGGVLFAMGSIAISTVFTLFDIKYSSEIYKLYGDWAIISLSIITPLFALTKIPTKDTFEKENFVENLFFSFLVKYIAIPFIYIYFLILYTYSIKVLMNFKEWPKGEVSWMVIGFSSFGYLIYMFSYIFEQKNKFIKIFRSYFPLVVLPQLIMLFYAIYLRINQYDITMNRYFVVVFGIWLAVISLYFIFCKTKQIIFIPIILTIFTLMISIGPWGVYSLPETRQLNRLQSNLFKAKILVNGKITPLKSYDSIDKNLSNEIYEGIEYLCYYNDCKSIKQLFTNEYANLEKNNFNINQENYNKSSRSLDNEPSKWQIISGITEEIKVKKSYNIGTYVSDTISIEVNNEQSIFPIYTDGYSKIYKINGTYGRNIKTNSGDYVDITGNNDFINIYTNGILSDTIDLKDINKTLYSLYSKSGKAGDGINDLAYIESKNMIFNVTSKNSKQYKILFEKVTLKNPDKKGETTYTIYNDTVGYLLAK